MRIGILGAGVAGLSTSYFLRHAPCDVEVHEASDVAGGLARSFNWHGFRCDLGPHRLFTADEEVLKQLNRLAPMRKVRRRSRVCVAGRWLHDPVNPLEIFFKFLPFRSLRLLWSYLLRGKHEDSNFETLALSRFGSGLYDLFFKPYSEKLFGIPANQISAEWGRRKLRAAGVKQTLGRNSRLYFKEFYYPVAGGYGAIADGLYDQVKHVVQLHSRLVRIEALAGGDGYRCQFAQNGTTVIREFDIIVSSLPVSVLAGLLGLSLCLRFRPMRLVYLLLNKSRATGLQWFYFADRDHIVNRVAEFKNFSSEGAPGDKTVLCCEVTEAGRYSPDRVIDELRSAGVLERHEVLDMMTLDLEHAYPIYDLEYQAQMMHARSFFSAHPNCFHVGRQAEFAHQDCDEVFQAAWRVSAKIQARLLNGRPEVCAADDALAEATC